MTSSLIILGTAFIVGSMGTGYGMYTIIEAWLSKLALMNTKIIGGIVFIALIYLFDIFCKLVCSSTFLY